jgi:hypothetical protein
MNKLIVAALVLLAALAQPSMAAAQVVSAPAPTATNSQGLPWWFVKHQYTPGMPWFYRAPTPPPQRQCQVVSWSPAQFWNTDEWGRTVTWTSYAPQYACN